MPHFHIGAAALNLTPLAWDSNRRHIVAALDAARDAGVNILCLPELCISGYGCEDMFLSAGVRQTALELLAELVPATHGLFTLLGLPVEHEGAVYNAVAVACDGRLVGMVCKQHLAGDGIHYEPRWFSPWPADVIQSLAVGGRHVPVGDLVFDCGGIRIGFEICHDAWVPDRPAPRLAARGVQLILNPSASHFAFGKQAIREGFVLRAALELGVSYVYTNLLGNEAGRAIYDGGALIAAGGEMVVRGPRFCFADVVLSSCVIDVPPPSPQGAEQASPGANHESCVTCQRPDSWKTTFPDIQPPPCLLYLADDNAADDNAAAVAISGQSPGYPQWESGPYVKQNEFSRAVPLALWDYLRKSRAQGFVVSLSGGADSSTTAVMVYLMVSLAGRELGFDVLAHKLAYLKDHAQQSPRDRRSWMQRLLACVYQATRNSSEVTRAAARTVADAIGAEFLEWSVDGSVEDYVATISHAVGRSLNWDEDDLALQNIQARARGPGVWMLANLRHALLLTTSNRSEAAVGYATMDGDTCGGLAPLAGIDKAFLRDWLRWMETTGPAGLEPLPALSVVNQQQPTAELRPQALGQTDEGDLMPYRVLDAIERAAIRDKQMPLAVFEAVVPQFPGYDRLQVGAWVERFFRLWCRNQWKRERYAPSFHLDDENLDPRTWCRFPILNGGYERELQQLRERVARLK